MVNRTGSLAILALFFLHPTLAWSGDCPPGLVLKEGKCVPPIVLGKKSICFSQAKTAYDDARRRCATHPTSGQTKGACLSVAQSAYDRQVSKCNLIADE
jgi:hypothetical protein